MGRVNSFLAELALAPARSLEALNDTFTVWLGDGYNAAAHEALDGRTPQAVFAADPQPIRPVEQQALHDAFLREETRKVDHTGCVKFRGTLVEIGAQYARRRITLRYAELPEGPDEVTAYDGDHRIGPVHALEWNRPFTPSDPVAAPSPAPSTRSRYLDALTRKGEKRRQAQGGIRFRQLEGPRDV